MAWVIDTCVLIDIAEEDPTFGVSSAKLIETHAKAGLTICPVTFVELAPVFNGDVAAQQEFLKEIGVAWPEQWTTTDTIEAFKTWHTFVQARRSGRLKKRPIADVLIGAFATRFDGLLTRNEADFRKLFPSLPIAVS